MRVPPMHVHHGPCKVGQVLQGHPGLQGQSNSSYQDQKNKIFKSLYSEGDHHSINPRSKLATGPPT
eukprot:1149495-Pelagomonas_calceolata.AAC.10